MRCHEFRRAALEWLEPRLLLSTYMSARPATASLATRFGPRSSRPTRHPGADTIILGSGTYRLTIANDPAVNNGIENNCLRGDLDVTDTLTIQGAGRDKTTIDAQQIDRVFQNFSSLTLKDLTVTNGAASNPYEPGGGGILSSGQLVLQNCCVTGNVAADKYYHTREGGGIYASGPLTITNSIISDNSAENGYGNGGGICSIYNDIVAHQHN